MPSIPNGACAPMTRCVLAASLALASLAAGAAPRSDAQATFQRDRAACLGKTVGEARATCLREAAAALQEARRGGLDDANADGNAQFERNRLLRCERQPVEDREDCVRRMNGEGTTTGTVEGGGILRELTTPAVPSGR